MRYILFDRERVQFGYTVGSVLDGRGTPSKR